MGIEQFKYVPDSIEDHVRVCKLLANGLHAMHAAYRKKLPFWRRHRMPKADFAEYLVKVQSCEDALSARKYILFIYNAARN